METQPDTIRRAAAGDGEAFAAAANAVRARLYRTAIVMLGTEADAEDAVDAALYNAWRHIKALREPRFFTTWVTRILINECNAALRRRKRETPAGETAISAQTCEYYDALPIREAVRQLPDELRTVIGLRYFADLTVPVVAGILKLPQGTVKSRQRKALALLRVELQE